MYTIYKCGLGLETHALHNAKCTRI